MQIINQGVILYTRRRFGGAAGTPFAQYVQMKDSDNVQEHSDSDEDVVSYSRYVQMKDSDNVQEHSDSNEDVVSYSRYVLRLRFWAGTFL
jgi:hypothetical protein